MVSKKLHIYNDKQVSVVAILLLNANVLFPL